MSYYACPYCQAELHTRSPDPESEEGFCRVCNEWVQPVRKP